MILGQKISRSKMTLAMNQDMIKATKISPQRRFATLETAKKIYDHTNDEYLKSIGLKVSDKFIELDCNSLPTSFPFFCAEL